MSVPVAAALLAGTGTCPGLGTPARVAPVYTVGHVLAGLARDPEAWTDRTFLLRGTGGTILASTDDGTSWSSRTSGTNDNLWGVGVACPGTSACFAVGSAGTDSARPSATKHGAD